ncbi:MAG: hypothetical protein J7K26_00450 [Candidatus Aenigmarchaeota archaeon]|nr:hypothetical protein [Candidatus Aenigmarchaeota archaeon]
MKNKILVSEKELLSGYSKPPYKKIRKAKDKGWLPLYPSPIIANIIGHIMGDGNLNFDNSKTGRLRFYGNIEKIKKIETELKKIGLYKYRIRKLEGEYELQFNNSVFCRIIRIACAPDGGKSIRKFTVPKWIMNGSKEIKKAFLQGIFDDELEGLYKDKRRKNSWQGLKFKMSKTDIKNLKNFLQQIRKLISSFHVQISEIKIDKKSFKRKDGKITRSCYFRIYTNYENRVKFYRNIGFCKDVRKAEMLLKSIHTT